MFKPHLHSSMDKIRAGEMSKCMHYYVQHLLHWPFTELLQAGTRVSKQNLWEQSEHFLQAECPFCQPTNSVKALNETQGTDTNQWRSPIRLHPSLIHWPTAGVLQAQVIVKNTYSVFGVSLKFLLHSLVLPVILMLYPPQLGKVHLTVNTYTQGLVLK